MYAIWLDFLIVCLAKKVEWKSVKKKYIGNIFEVNFTLLQIFLTSLFYLDEINILDFS